MAKKDDGLNLDLDLDDINLDFDPVKDKRKPITKISTSFGKGMFAEMASLSSLTTMAKLALPTGYGKAIDAATQLTMSGKQLWGTAAKELQPLNVDIKKAVQKVLPRASKILPDSVQKKIDSMTQPEAEVSGSPSAEDQQTNEIASTLTNIFQAQTQIQGQQNAQNSAYRQVRDQISDDQFARGYAASATIARGISRLVDYQDSVTQQYQRKSLELQYRQFFATRELLKVTGKGMESQIAHLKGIMHNTSLPDFAKSNEFGKIENTLAKRLAESMFPGAQKFMSTYFANFTNEMGNRVRENLQGFIDAYRGVKDMHEMSEGMDKHTMVGNIMGSKAGEWARDRLGGVMAKHFKKSKMVKRLGHRLGYTLGNFPGLLNRFTKDYTDHTDKHGKVVGTLMNIMRDILPQVNGPSNVIGGTSILRGDAAVSFNMATRQSLTEVIPGYLSRIHHELVVMRTGDVNAQRITWDPTKGRFGTAKSTSKNVHDMVYRKDEIDRFHRASTDYLTAVDKNHKLSRPAEDAIRKKLAANAASGNSHMDPRDFMEMDGVTPEVAKELRDHYLKTFKLDEDGAVNWKRSNRQRLEEASVAHSNAMTTMAGIRERVQALNDAGMGEHLLNSGIVDINDKGEMLFNIGKHDREMLKDRNRGAKFSDAAAPMHGTQARPLGGMEAIATGGGGVDAETLKKFADAMDSFNKDTDELLREMREGSLVSESKRQVQVLNSILEVLNTRDFSKSKMDEMLKGAGAKASALKDKVVHWGEDGWAWVVDKAGRAKKINVKNMTEEARAKLYERYKDLKENHGEYFDKASRKGRAAARLARMKSRGWGASASQRYSAYMQQEPEGFFGHAGHFIGSGVGLAGSALGLGWKAGSGLFKGGLHVAGYGAKGMWGVTEFAGRTAAATGRGIRGAYRWFKDDVVDVYIDGQKQPCIYAKYMATGRYVDAVDGKPIRTIKDIHGPVKDVVENRIVLTAEEYAEGRWGSMTRRIGKKITGGAWAIARWLAKISFSPFTLVKNAVKGVWNAARALKRWVTYDTDIYVGGEKMPRLEGTRMAQNKYAVVDKDGKVVKVVHKASDITGPVKDLETGQFKLMQEDLDRGIYNALGHNVTRAIKAVWNLGVGLAKLPFKAMQWTWKAAKAIGGTAASLIGGGLGGLIDHLNRGRKGFDDKQAITLMKLQLGTQKAIFQLLHERLRKPKSLRKGSWEEKFMAEHNAATKAATAGTAGGKAFGGLGSLAAWFKNKFHKKKDEDKDGGNSLTDDAQDAKDAWDGIKGVRGGIKNWRRLRQLNKLRRAGQLGEEGLKELDVLSKGTRIGRMAGRLGRIGEWGSKAINAVRGVRTAGMVAEGAGDLTGIAGAGAEAAGVAATAGEGAAVAAGAAGAVGEGAAVAAGAGGLAAEGAAGAAAVAGGILTAPVLLIAGAAVAVAGLGYLGWKAWKNRGPKDFMRLRLAMYGIDMENSREVEKVLNLEDTVIPNINVTGGKATFTMKGLNQMKMMKDFGVDLGDSIAVNSFAGWFNGRFRPILCNTLAALQAIAPTVKLPDMDRELKPKQKKDLLDKLKGIPHSFYEVNTDPFKGQKKWFFWKVGSIQAGWHSVDAAFKLAEASIDAAVKDSTKDHSVLGEMGAGFLLGGPLGAIKGAYDAITHNKEAAANRKAEADAKKKDAQAKPKTSDAAAKAAATAAAAATALAAGGATKLTSNVVQMPTLKGSVLTANQCIRYKQYGLTDLDRDKVAVLFALETYVLDKVDFAKGAQATFTDDITYYYTTYASQFGVVNGDKDTRKTWLDWFKARFLPTLLAYATAVSQVNPNIKVLDAESYLKPTDLLQVAKSMMGAKSGKDYSDISVWSISYSPWPNYKLNMNQDTTKPNVDYLNTQVAKQKLDEQKGVPYKKPDQSNGEKPGSKGAAPNPLLPTGQPTKDQVKQYNAANDPNNYGGGFGQGANGGKSSGGVSGFGAGAPISDSSAIIKEPGNGTGGDINKIPMPGPGASWSSAKGTIVAAANMAGVDPEFMGAIAGIESGYDPSVKAKTSSATGYFQFIHDTWKTMLKKYGPKYGIAPNTSPTDPRANALMGAEYVRENMEYLKRNLHRPITQADLYLAHFLGPGGAVDMLRMPGGSPAAQAMPKAAAANKSIFYDKNRPRSVDEVVAMMGKKVQSHRVDVSGAMSPTGANLGPVTGMPGTSNGMAGSIAKAANDAVGPAKDANGKSTVTGLPSSPNLAAATAASSGPSGPASLSPSSVKPIAATPTPDIASAMPTGGGSMYSGDDSSVANSRVQMQRSAAANDDVSRQSTAARVADLGTVSDILTKSLTVQSSMDGTLKAILGALGNGGSTAASGTATSATPGPSGSSAASAASAPLAAPAVNLDRKYGG